MCVKGFCGVSDDGDDKKIDESKGFPIWAVILIVLVPIILVVVFFVVRNIQNKRLVKKLMENSESVLIPSGSVTNTDSMG